MALFGLTRLGKLKAFLKSPLRQTRRANRDFTGLARKKFDAATARRRAEDADNIARFKKASKNMSAQQLAAAFQKLTLRNGGGISARAKKQFDLAFKGQRRKSVAKLSASLGSTIALSVGAPRAIAREQRRKKSRKSTRSR